MKLKTATFVFDKATVRFRDKRIVVTDRRRMVIDNPFGWWKANEDEARHAIKYAKKQRKQ